MIMRSLIALLLVGAPAALPAQGVTALELAPGTRVRVQAPALPTGRTQGVVWYLRSDTLHLLQSRQSSTALHLASIDKIEVERDGSLAAVTGMVAGAVIGGLVGYRASFSRDRPGLAPGWHVAEIGGSAAVGGALGGLAGAIFGNRWKQVFPTASRR
ncbi:hypothetical protein BH23GEM5_BH23GEM5_09330 [soil metagenome]